jgi:alpha-mannosidase
MNKGMNILKCEFFCLGIVMSLTSAKAQYVSSIGNVDPVQYEKRDGHLMIKSFITLSSVPRKMSLKMDGRTIPFRVTGKADSILVWLPMIGKEKVLTVNSGNKLLEKRMFTPVIGDDWGYFSQGTINIIQSSHQDIAWMNTPEYCRNERINDIIIPALDMMKTDKDFKFEMEQTLNLMEVLEAHPERKQEIIQRYKEKRFVWGATYNQPYEGLSTGEQLVRQVYNGRKWIKENLPGCDDFTANNVDVPGRAMQMPQIFAKSGIKNLFISRFKEGFYDWYSPDGSKVLTYSPGNYGWAVGQMKYFEKDAVMAMHKLQSQVLLWSNYFRSRHIPPHYAVLISCDATKPVSYKKVIDEWNRIVDEAEIALPRLENSTSETYFNMVNTADSRREEVRGERPDLWLYIHGPAHYEQTVDKRKAGVVLPAAEMFTSLSDIINKDWSYPRPVFDRAWAASIYPDHGLGGKFGNITDSIYADSLAVARRLGEGLLKNAVSSIADKVSTASGNIILFNDLTWNRNSVVDYPSASKNVMVEDLGGKVIPSQHVTLGGKDYIRFIAKQVPSVGYTTYKLVSAKKVDTSLPTGVEQGDNFYSNDYYEIVFGNGGIKKFYDKSLHRNLSTCDKFAFGDVIDVGYKGNGAGEFTQITEVDPWDWKALSQSESHWRIASTGAVSTTFVNEQQTRFAKVIQSVTVYHQIKKVDFDVTLDSFTGEHNRQYRIMFPLDMEKNDCKINYEVPMGVAEVGKSEITNIPGGWAWGGTYTHHPSSSHPREIQNFISANGNGFGFTMSSCVAVADWLDPSVNQADYPILQGILLSSHKSCHGEGNWYSQEGTHHYHFSIIGHNEGWKNGYAYAIEANHPIVTTLKGEQKGTMEPVKSFIKISDPLVAISTMKKADNDNAIILRLTEMEGKDKEVTVTLPFNASKVLKTDLIEEEKENLNMTGNVLKLKLGHHSIETYKIILP